MQDKYPCVYILASKKNGTLYTGVTSNLVQRVGQHRAKGVDSFTKKYTVNKLVYFEQCDSMEGAILREKQIKGGSRKKKIDLIERVNPEWKDMYFDL
jgi:putative endonuclease